MSRFGGKFRSHHDERLKDGKIPIECWLSLSEASSALPWISPVSRDIAKDLFSKITKRDAKSNVAETILIESFDMLAGSESEQTNESFETIVQDLLRKCLMRQADEALIQRGSRLQNNRGGRYERTNFRIEHAR